MEISLDSIQSTGPLIPMNTISFLPDEIMLFIFSHLPAKDLARSGKVNRNWHRIASDTSLKKIHLHRELESLEAKGRFIGANIWNECIGDVGEVPPLPENILEILNSPCPWTNPEKKKDGNKVKDTHIFALIPKEVAREEGEEVVIKPLTINSIEELVQKPKKGNPTKYNYIKDEIREYHGDSAVIESY